MLLEANGIEKISPNGPPTLSKEGQGVPMVRLELTIMPNHAWGETKSTRYQVLIYGAQYLPMWQPTNCWHLLTIARYLPTYLRSSLPATSANCTFYDACIRPIPRHSCTWDTTVTLPMYLLLSVASLRSPTDTNFYGNL